MPTAGLILHGFVLGEFGSDLCPPGSEAVPADALCETAASALGLSYASSASDAAHPQVCYGNATHGYLGTHAVRTHRRICESPSTRPKPTASAPSDVPLLLATAPPATSAPPAAGNALAPPSRT